MPIDPGTLPSGIQALDPNFISSLAYQLMGVMLAGIVAVTWRG